MIIRQPIKVLKRTNRQHDVQVHPVKNGLIVQKKSYVYFFCYFEHHAKIKLFRKRLILKHLFQVRGRALYKLLFQKWTLTPSIQIWEAAQEKFPFTFFHSCVENTDLIFIIHGYGVEDSLKLGKWDVIDSNP